jgi:zinc protease
VLKTKLDAALALIADVLLRPDYPALEAEKLEREILAQLDELRDDDGQLARRFFQRAMWGSHPYGRSIMGSQKSLAGITVDDARAWQQRVVRTGNLVIGFAGDLDERAAHAAVERHFSGVPGSPAIARPVVPDPPGRRDLRLTLVDKPDRTQSQILLGQPAPLWGTPAFYALQVATCAYGGTFTARLMNEVRSKRGLSYGASARMGQGRGRKSLVVHVFPSLEQTCETLELVLGLHQDFIANGVTAEELEFAKGYLANSFAFGVATPEDRLELKLALELTGLPADYAATFPSRIRAVTLEETKEAMRTQLSGGGLEVCIVSTADELRPKLDETGLSKRFQIDTVSYDSY